MRPGSGTAPEAVSRIAFVVLAALSWTVPAKAQQAPEPTRISSVTMTATVVPGEEDVEVLLEYRLERTPGAAPEPVLLHVLRVGGTEILNILVETPGAPDQSRALTLSEQDGVRESATIDPAMLPGDALLLSYRVSGAVELQDGAGRIRLPLLVLDLPLVGTTRSTFQTAIEVPEEWRVSGTFPSGLAATTPGIWTADLQVVPAFVSISARPDGAWRPGLPWALDVATVLILLGVGFVGWRHLSGVVREARA